MVEQSVKISSTIVSCAFLLTAALPATSNGLPPPPKESGLELPVRSGRLVIVEATPSLIAVVRNGLVDSATVLVSEVVSTDLEVDVGAVAWERLSLDVVEAVEADNDVVDSVD